MKNTSKSSKCLIERLVKETQKEVDVDDIFYNNNNKKSVKEININNIHINNNNNNNKETEGNDNKLMKPSINKTYAEGLNNNRTNKSNKSINLLNPKKFNLQSIKTHSHKDINIKDNNHNHNHNNNNNISNIENNNKINKKNIFLNMSSANYLNSEFDRLSSEENKSKLAQGFFLDLKQILTPSPESDNNEKDKEKSVVGGVNSNSIGNLGNSNNIGGNLSKDKLDQKFKSDSHFQNLMKLKTLKPTLIVYEEKRPYIKFKNVYDSFEDDTFELTKLRKSYNINPFSDLKVMLTQIHMAFIIFVMIYNPILMCRFSNENNNTILFGMSKDTFKSLGVVANTNNPNSNNYLEIFIIQFIIEIFFTLDFILNFLTGVTINDSLSYCFTDIFVDYFRRSFLTDFISCLPVSYLLLSDPTYNQYIFVLTLKLIKISHIYKFVSLEYLMKENHKNIGNFGNKKKNNTKIQADTEILDNIKRFIFPILNLLIVVHFFTCTWITLGEYEVLSNENYNWLTESHLLDEPFSEKYTASLYFTLATILSVGYGDIRSFSMKERIFNIVFLIISVFIYSFVLSAVSFLLQKYTTKRESFVQKMKYLDFLCIIYNIPDTLYNKLKQSINFQSHQINNERSELLQSLPNNLKNEIYITLYKDKISTINILKNQPKDFLLFVIPLLKSVILEKGDTVVSHGMSINEMFMVYKGSVVFELDYSYQFYPLLKITSKQNYGDILMYTEEKSPFEIKVGSNKTELIIISKESFNQMKQNFPDTCNHLQKRSFKNYLLIEDKRKRAKLFYKKHGTFEGFKKETTKHINNILNSEIDDWHTKHKIEMEIEKYNINSINSSNKEINSNSNNNTDIYNNINNKNILHKLENDFDSFILKCQKNYTYISTYNNNENTNDEDGMDNNNNNTGILKSNKNNNKHINAKNLNIINLKKFSNQDINNNQTDIKELVKPSNTLKKLKTICNIERAKSEKSVNNYSKKNSNSTNSFNNSRKSSIAVSYGSSMSSNKYKEDYDEIVDPKSNENSNYLNQQYNFVVNNPHNQHSNQYSSNNL